MATMGIATTMYQCDREYQSRGLAFDEHLGGAFREMAELGLDGVQSMLSYADTAEKADRFGEICSRAGVQIAGLYGNCRLYDADTQSRDVEEFLGSVETAKRAGWTLIALNMLQPSGRPKTDSELYVQARGLQLVGEAASAMGVGVAIHNHNEIGESFVKDQDASADRTE